MQGWANYITDVIPRTYILTGDFLRDLRDRQPILEGSADKELLMFTLMQYNRFEDLEDRVDDLVDYTGFLEDTEALEYITAENSSFWQLSNLFFLG